MDASAVRQVAVLGAKLQSELRWRDMVEDVKIPVQRAGVYQGV